MTMQELGCRRVLEMLIASLAYANLVGAVVTPLHYRKIDRSRHGQASPVGAAVEPCCWRSDGRKLYSRSLEGIF
jgi:hypothetical protein